MVIEGVILKRRVYAVRDTQNSYRGSKTRSDAHRKKSYTPHTHDACVLDVDFIQVAWIMQSHLGAIFFGATY